MSLDDLAVASGVSRAALSHIETSKGNPTVGVLWKIAVGLGMPFSDFLGEAREEIGVLRRAESQVLRSADGKMESRPLTPAGAAPWAELYELRLAARAVHTSDAHAPGTREILIVLSGQLRLRVGKRQPRPRSGRFRVLRRRQAPRLREPRYDGEPVPRRDPL